MSVGRICSREVILAAPDETVADAAARMDREKVGTLVVTDEERRPVGIVTDRDLALAIARYNDLEGLLAADVMTPDPITVHEDATAVDLPAAMAEGRVRRIPVVDDDGDLAGIATLDDVVATAGEMLKDVATVIEWQSREYRPEADV